MQSITQSDFRSDGNSIISAECVQQVNVNDTLKFQYYTNSNVPKFKLPSVFNSSFAGGVELIWHY